jgi:hypothetical protein
MMPLNYWLYQIIVLMVPRFCCSYVDICVVLYGDYKFLGILSGFNALFPLESAQGSGHWC